MPTARLFALVRSDVAPLMMALAALSCATGPIVAHPDSYENRKRGYEIGRPDVPPGSWKRITLRGADLAFRRSAGDGPAVSMALMSECGRPQADAGTLARQLLIGLDERVRVASGPVEVAGQPAYSQTFETREGAQRIRVKSVTLTSGPCTFDWVLVAPGDFGEAEQEFDRWRLTWVHNSKSLAQRDGERAP